MKKKIKEKWIKALKSGKYKQTTGKLFKFNKKTKKVEHCCLGVLCDLHSKETGNKIVCKKNNTNYYYFEDKFSLPEEVSKWAGLNDGEGTLKTPIVINDQTKWGFSLVDLNDDQKFTFKQIAEVIEKEF